ncbi:alkyl sulfatase C-terminal domain-containing protein [Streptomyces sp. NPDC003016]
MAVRIDGPRAWAEDLVIDLRLTDEARRHRLTLHNGALTRRSVPDGSPVRTPAQLTLTLTKPQLLGVLAGKGLEGVGQEGDPQALTGQAVPPGDPALGGLRDHHPLTTARPPTARPLSPAHHFELRAEPT